MLCKGDQESFGTSRKTRLGLEMIGDCEVIDINVRGQMMKILFGVSKKAPVLRAATYVGGKTRTVPFVDRDPFAVIFVPAFHSLRGEGDCTLVKWLVRRCSQEYTRKKKSRRIWCGPRSIISRAQEDSGRDFGLAGFL